MYIHIHAMTVNQPLPAYLAAGGRCYGRCLHQEGLEGHHSEGCGDPEGSEGDTPGDGLDSLHLQCRQQ